MLEHASRIESERAERIVKAAVRLVEPALIIVFGGLVALVAAALLQAVYAVRP
jgi:type II secretory pathway component PulF